MAEKTQSTALALMLAMLRATSYSGKASQATEKQLYDIYRQASRDVNKIIREETGLTRPGDIEDWLTATPIQMRAVDSTMRRINEVLDTANRRMQSTLAVGLMSYAAGNADDVIKAANKALPKESGLEFKNTLSILMVTQLVNAPLAGETFQQRLAGYAFNSSRQMRAALLDSVTQGSAISTMQRRLQSIMLENIDKPITLLIATEYERVQNDLVRALFRQPENRRYISGFVYVTALNSSVCRICARDHGKFYPINTRMRVPRHPRCRCRMIPKLRKWQDLRDRGVDIPGGLRPAFSGKMPTKGYATFDDFLNSQSEEFQREYLGPGRYDLFKRGVSTRDMANHDRAFSIDEIKAKAAIKKKRAREMIKVGAKHGTFNRRKSEKAARIVSKFKRRLAGNHRQDSNCRC